ncbi:hypothetical protein IMG5_203670 [Ichthyophthirius multifiliis]|uniref:Ion transport domain-containing protein n=1 Tax=Ichthyophthirius multifiliis TaxID=5932 RepID=G0R6D1_ICHMU|nr:hypothetical protein IMG5_203670 [Ichthyophthirius multifiliis]EGR26968.1 hypothetical protein IMG5_203670 [Ichthyophthirius multifiliis]|eukprot:XP_004023852.1 hypothetical protein IMG5_203670 [Ichthyophthirius multifiliis]
MVHHLIYLIQQLETVLQQKRYFFHQAKKIYLQIKTLITFPFLQYILKVIFQKFGDHYKQLFLKKNLKSKNKFLQIKAIFIIYTVIFNPYTIAFDEDQNDIFNNLQNIVDIFFWIDLFVNMFSTYYDDDKQVVLSIKTVLCTYFKTWFIIDFLSCFPFDLLAQNIFEMDNNDAKYSLKIFKISRFPRLYKILKITKIFKINLYINNSQILNYLSINTGFVRIFSLFFQLTILIHVISCVWYYQAKLLDFCEQTWVYRNQMISETNKTLYITSIYYVITTITTVGYGDITSFSQPEIIISIILMLLGVGFYSILIGILVSVLQYMDIKDNNLQKKILTMNDFCNEMNVGVFLKNKLRDYIQYSMDKNCFQWANQSRIFDQLPISLRYEICMNIHGGVIRKFNIFYLEADQLFMVKIVPLLQPIKFQKGEVIWQDGDDPDSCIYFYQFIQIFFINKIKVYLLSSGRINFQKILLKKQCKQ